MVCFRNIGRLLATFLILGVFPVCGRTQVYRYLGIEDGLSDRMVYCIRKDVQDYMWFLTPKGVDRYDGRTFKHYTLSDCSTEAGVKADPGWLFTDSAGGLWGIGRGGHIFHYDISHDSFLMIYGDSACQAGNAMQTLHHAYMDRNDRIWLCYSDHVIRYDIHTGMAGLLKLRHISGNITAITGTDGTRLFIGTEKGLFLVREKGDRLEAMPDAGTDSIRVPVSGLCYHPGSKRLFVGTFGKGILAYDMRSVFMTVAGSPLQNTGISRITSLNDRELLAATAGKGVFRLDAVSLTAEPYITTDYDSHNGMNGDNINDIHVDGEGRVWLAVYPAGVTIRNSRYASYEWFRHSPGNSRSLVNDRVHEVIGDSDGDLWFATDNGISLLGTADRRWHSFSGDGGGHIFLTLCEVSPGVIWAGGYAPGIYRIDKRGQRAEYLPLPAGTQPDRYVSVMEKDSKGSVWAGGYYNLRHIDPGNGTVHAYPVPAPVTAILEKEPGRMWIGTGRGLYLLDSRRESFHQVTLPFGTVHVRALYQASDSLLYIGTGGTGLLAYDCRNGRLLHRYHTENCALISNDIYAIVPRAGGDLMLGTGNSIVSFHCGSDIFRNWTAERGLRGSYFNTGVLVCRHDSSFVFGSGEGAVMFPADMRIPAPGFSGIRLRDFMISYRPVLPGGKDSPLREDINRTDRLELAYDQNTFSLEAASVNYDYPSNILYSWRMEGFRDGWSRPSQSGLIQFTGLSPGEYILHIRAVSNEEKYRVYGERSVGISVARPPWAGPWAVTGYMLACLLCVTAVFRIAELRRQKRLADEKTRFFIHAAHDIRTPLTLIKAPLEETVEKGMVVPEGVSNVRLALKNVDSLLQQATDLIDFERADVRSRRLHVSEHGLADYLEGTCSLFIGYASVRGISLVLEDGLPRLSVRFDREKMDSILKNILSNALKYTPSGGSIRVRAFTDEHAWVVEVEDTGIGIPKDERGKLFRKFFRGSNAVNLKVGGSGIGLTMVRRLVRLHGGRISITGEEGKGTRVRLLFPLRDRRLRNLSPAVQPEGPDCMPVPGNPDCGIVRASVPVGSDTSRFRILVVEDHDDLRGYLEELLGRKYHVRSCSNGRDALFVAREYNPDLVISDIMMPEMDGRELCASLKSDIETSHIPILLLTALGDERDMLEGLGNGADAYITKPFSLEMLRASVENILANRIRLRQAYSRLGTGREAPPPDCHNVNDWKFIASVKECIVKNIDNPEFGVDMLCGMQHMSRTGFFNKLKALTGNAPADYIRSIRLQRAEQLLREGDHTITEVAEAAGFCDARYFREVFRKYYGMSPSDYRKSDRE